MGHVQTLLLSLWVVSIDPEHDRLSIGAFGICKVQHISTIELVRQTGVLKADANNKMGPGYGNRQHPPCEAWHMSNSAYSRGPE
jgi:hypothetical protein